MKRVDYEWEIENILYDAAMDLLKEKYHNKMMNSTRISVFAKELDTAFFKARKQYPKDEGVRR